MDAVMVGKNAAIFCGLSFEDFIGISADKNN